MGKLWDILKKDVPGTRRRRSKKSDSDDTPSPKYRPSRNTTRFDIVVVLMVLAGPAGILYYLSIHRRMHLRRSAQVLTRIRLIVSSNAPLAEGIYQVALDAPRRISQILLGIARELEEGYTLSEALAFYPSVVPDLYRNQVRIGEETGQLVQALDHVIEAMALERQNRETAFTNYSYIIFVFLAQTGVMSFLWFKVLPVFEEIVVDSFEQSKNVNITIDSILPYRLMNIASPDAVMSAATTIILGVSAIVLLHRFSFGQNLVCPFLYRVPFLGRLLKLKEQARVTQALELLVRADVPIRDALVRVRDLELTSPFRRGLAKVATRINQGDSLKDALKPARRLFTADFIEALTLGEYAGSLSESCTYAATSTTRNLSKLNRQLTDSIIPVYALVGGAINLWVCLILHGFIMEIANVLSMP